MLWSLGIELSSSQLGIEHHRNYITLPFRIPIRYDEA